VIHTILIQVLPFLPKEVFEKQRGRAILDFNNSGLSILENSGIALFIPGVMDEQEV
jgi:hypothetical protein